MGKSETNNSSAMRILLPPVAVGLALTLALMFIGAVLVQRALLPEGAIRPLALVFLFLGCLTAAFGVARRAPGSKLPWAVAGGLTVLVVLLLIGLAAFVREIHVLPLFLSIVCAVAASALGGIAAAGLHRNPRYKHLKK